MSEQATTAPPVKKRRPPIGILLVVLLGVAGYFVWKNYLQPQPVPASILYRLKRARMEGDDSTVSPKVSGRLVEIHFREGDTVKKGEVIAVMDDVQARAREEQVKASIPRRRSEAYGWRRIR